MNAQHRQMFDHITAGMNESQKAQLERDFEARIEQEEYHQKIHQQAVAAHKQAAEVQHMIDTRTPQQYAVIVAMDEMGGFSKDGEIPWHYSEDFKRFKQLTTNHICVMGRVTYDDINKRLGDKAENILLPNRKTFVVTSKDLPRKNAIAIKHIGDVENHFIDEDFDKTVFFCGGEQIYNQGIKKSQTAYVTIVNKNISADRFFPVEYLLAKFKDPTIEKSGIPDEIRFLTFKRNI